ncbi:unnamed protein product [Dracunculus medinensis]|uniref:Doublecortin domain-containing protein n=1 Tax=Dracunculus medinensis TaxID=318479 RepID=A0A3P7QDU1_DRAME|nr:unnamed protein product [Dracunculus medinensis]
MHFSKITFTASSVYDPFGKTSFIELNKQRRGHYERPSREKIYNRPPPPVKKIYLRKNGDINYRPKLFIWRIWLIPRLKELIEEAGSFVGIEKGETLHLYDYQGSEITNENDIRDGMLYVVAGEEDFDMRSSDLPNYVNTVRSAPNVTSTDSRSANKSRVNLMNGSVNFPEKEAVDPLQSNIATENNNDPYCVVANSPNKKRYFNVPPVPHEPLVSNYGYEDRYGDFDNCDIFANGDRSRTRKKHNFTGHGKPTVKNQSIMRESGEEIGELHGRKRGMNPNHKMTNGAARRSRSEVIYNRKDQTHPDVYIIYVFLNGQGMESQYINFKRSQLEKGMDFILELIARRFSVKPSRLCNMDGKKIHRISDMMSRGAYVLVPIGQAFRETWYFLPDNAIDTRSVLLRLNKKIHSDAEKIMERNNQRDRLKQLRERHRSKVRASMARTRQQNR